MSLLVRDANGTNQYVGTACSSDGTYRYAVSQITPLATPTQFAYVQGSATKSVRVKLLKLTGFSNAAGSMQVQVGTTAALGTANAGTTLTTVTAVKHDTNSAAATAVVKYVQGANYDTPATLTLVSTGRLPFSTAATSVEGVLKIDFSQNADLAPVLRGVAEFLVVSFNGDGIPGTSNGRVDLVIETEESSA